MKLYREVAEFSNVPGGSEHANRLAGLGRHHSPATQIMRLTVGPENAILHIEQRVSVYGACNCARGRLFVLGVERPFPNFCGLWPCLFRSSIQCKHGRVPDDAVSEQIPLPNANLAGMSGCPHPFEEPQALAFGIFGFRNVLKCAGDGDDRSVRAEFWLRDRDDVADAAVGAHDPCFALIGAFCSDGAVKRGQHAFTIVRMVRGNRGLARQL